MRTFIRPPKNLGYTLLELTLVIAVISGIILATTSYYQSAKESAKVTQATSMISNVANAGFTWVGGKRNGFAELNDIGVLTNAGLLPSNYQPDATINPWQGTINATLGDSNNEMKIEITNVPNKACTLLKQKVTNVGGNTSKNLCDSNQNHFTAIFVEN